MYVFVPVCVLFAVLQMNILHFNCWSQRTKWAINSMAGWQHLKSWRSNVKLITVSSWTEVAAVAPPIAAVCTRSCRSNWCALLCVCIYVCMHVCVAVFISAFGLVCEELVRPHYVAQMLLPLPDRPPGCQPTGEWLRWASDWARPKTKIYTFIYIYVCVLTYVVGAQIQLFALFYMQIIASDPTPSSCLYLDIKPSA